VNRSLENQERTWSKAHQHIRHPITGVIAVTATDQNDRKGEIVDFGRRIDLCAPGVSICTTDLGGTYSFRNGTSFAAAYVSGLAALILSINKELTNDMVRSLLKQSCDPIDNKIQNRKVGWAAGRINASAAVLATLSFTCLAIARMNPSELEAKHSGMKGCLQIERLANIIIS